MFTGIIETLGIVTNLRKEQENLQITLKSNFTSALKIDQSIAHNGVCLTVVAIKNETYRVTAIKETITKTTIGTLQVNDLVNLERAMKLGDRLDGHIVQGHIDQTGICISKIDENGSTIFRFRYDVKENNSTIEKGSVTVNGVSLTVINANKSEFSVAVIPYTLEHTTFKNIKKGDLVNIEFDVIGKYVRSLLMSS